MGKTTTIPKVREGSDIRLSVTLTDNGVAVDWTGLTGISVWVYSDRLRAVSGFCRAAVKDGDPTVLICDYGAGQPQREGINSIVVRCRYNGRVKTYDNKAFEIVPRSADTEGEETVIEDPELDVELNVSEVSTSLLDNAIDAALEAAKTAEEAAESATASVDAAVGSANAKIEVAVNLADEAAEAAQTAAGLANQAVTDTREAISETKNVPKIGDNGDWMLYNPETKAYEDSGKPSKGGKGDTGTGIASVEQTRTSDENGGENEVTVTLTDGTGSVIRVRNGSTAVVDNLTTDDGTKALSARQGVELTRMKWWGDITGNNNNAAASLIYGLMPGRAYRMRLDKNVWDMTGVTYGGGYAKLQIDSIDSEGAATTLIQYNINQKTSKETLFTVPEGSARIRVLFRATKGETVRLTIEDEGGRSDDLWMAGLNRIGGNKFRIGRTITTSTSNGVTFTKLSDSRFRLDGTATAATNFNLWGGAGDRYEVRPGDRHVMLRCFDDSVTVADVWGVFGYFRGELTHNSGTAIYLHNRWWKLTADEYATFGRDYVHVVAGATFDNAEFEMVSSDHSLSGELNSQTFNASYHEGARDFADKCGQFSALLLGDTVNGVEAPSDCESFLFFTDPHLLESSGWEYRCHEYIAQIQKYYNSTPTTFCLCGGDWLGNSDLPDTACYKLGYVDGFMRSMFKDLVMLVGNHDTNYQGKKDADSATKTTRLSNQSIVNLWYRRRGKAYFTYDGARTRFYCLDTGIENQTMEAFGDYGWTQAAWLAGSLLSETAEHIAIAAHILYYSGTSLQPLTKQALLIAQAYNSRGTITVNGTTYDYASAKGRVEFGIFGHLHSDGQPVVNDVPCVLTTNVRDNSAKGPSFDLVLADYGARKITMVRVGSGDDREISLAE